MLNCFVESAKDHGIEFAAATTTITIIAASEYNHWLKTQAAPTLAWLQSIQFRGDANTHALLPDINGHLAGVIFCCGEAKNFWGFGALPLILPEGVYALNATKLDLTRLVMAWGLGAYQFTRYKKAPKTPARLQLPPTVDRAHVVNLVESIYLIRNLINTPTEDMGPTELAAVTQTLADTFKATLKQIIGADLLTENYHCIHAVGRACDDAPRLLDLRWGDPAHPKITLVGKGVCFDTGGLDLKPASAMLLMKKDMAGAANTLGLARLIMQHNLPVRLRVLIPAVENSVAGNAFRPGDVIKSRKGLTVEIGNTDAEGRLVLADALTEAVTEKPELLINLATLTGAARIAVGTDIAAMFCNNDTLAAELQRHADNEADPLWRLPLYSGYRDALNSTIADLNNSAPDGYAGAITAGLFLKEFVPDDIPWIHFDMMAWNLKSRPGRPIGGEAMAIRALFAYLLERYPV